MRRMRRIAAFHSIPKDTWRQPSSAARLSARTRTCSDRLLASSWPTSRRPGESLLLIANGHDTKSAKPGARVDRAKLR
jgi:integrase